MINGMKSSAFWDKVGQFWPIKHAIDDLQQLVGVSGPEQIADCFKRQSKRLVTSCARVGKGAGL